MIKYVKLSDVCNVLRGTTITKKQTVPGKIPVIGGGRKATYFHNKHNRDANVITISASGASAGLVNFWSEPIFASDCSTVDLKDNNHDIKFIYYFLKSLQEYIYKKLRHGAAQPHVYAKDISNLKFPLLNIERQRYIVEKLDDAYNSIGEFQKNLNTKIVNLKDLFEKYLLNVFNNKNYEEYKLGDICKFIGGSQPPKSNFETESKDSNIRFIQIRDYKSDKNIVYIPKNKAKRFCDINDVMIGRYGPPIFQILRGIEGSYNVALMKAVPNKNLNNDYLFYLLKNKKIQDYVIKKSVRAAGQSGVNKATLEPFKVNIPPKNIQKKIIENVKLIEEKIKKISEISNVNLKNIELLKSLLLTNFITKNQHNE